MNEMIFLDGNLFPKIGDIVNTEQALALCMHFELDYLVKRIETFPERYKSWKFDGCSCLPDQVLGFFFKMDWRDITYKCCLPHDLGYAYGEHGNEEEKEKVDVAFYSHLIEVGMKEWAAKAFLEAVRIGGAEEFGTNFSWGYALRREYAFSQLAMLPNENMEMMMKRKV